MQVALAPCHDDARQPLWPASLTLKEVLPLHEAHTLRVTPELTLNHRGALQCRLFSTSCAGEP